MYFLKVTSNIMSLAGIAIAIGEMVDASIVMVENAHKKLEEWEARGKPGERLEVVIQAAKEVGPSLFFSLLVITVAFLPVFALQAQAGMLFRPLAYTKTFAILFSAFLAITLTPALMTLFIRGKIRSEEKNPLSVFLRRIYEPVVKFTLRFKTATIFFAIVVVALTIYPFLKIGREFMPPLYEGSLFYMPVTVPSPSISEISKVLQIQDKILMKIPEVAQVFGKAGRAETATDPAPLEMFETVINLKPESEWRKGMTVDQLKNEMDEALTIPGVANLFTMPIKARIDMLSTGIRTPVGIKVLGPRIEELEKIGLQIENVLKTVPGTRNVYAERLTTGYFLDINVKRDEAARYGLTVDDVQEVVQSTIGGKNITTTVEGRERYPVNVRYARDLRSSIEKMKRVLVPVTFGGNSSQIPLAELAEIKIIKGPSVIKSDEGTLVSYVYIDYSGRDMGGYIEQGRKRLASLKIPDGYRIEWSGDYESLVKTEERMKFVIPLTALIIFLLVYFNTNSVAKTLFVLLSVPFSLVGSFWLLHLLNYNMSTASWVGIIALAGISVETGIVMFLFLELAYQKWKEEGRLKTEEDLKEAIVYGAVKRLRPKVMTVATNLGLIPILFSTGMGADVMQRIAAPVIGGLLTSLVLVLIIFPVLYMVWRGKELSLK
jgi:Cu(I)/Ag(I) efflux system membrane protein CusA/SilA